MDKVKIGVLGLGMMGNTHLDVYGSRDDVEVTAVADADPDRLQGREVAGGNIEGQAKGGYDLASLNRYDDAADLIEREELDVIDVCLPTPIHLPFAVQALKKGRHVLVEKPVCRTLKQAEQLLAAAEDAGDSIIMPAMCIRFWPGWDTLREFIADQRFGKLHGLSIQRLASHPGGEFYRDPEACGGALLDLHIHDTDFISYCLGMPESVSTVGYKLETAGWDHISTQYHYPDHGLVVAEGGWAQAPGFPFTMRYVANFDRATVHYDLGSETPFTLFHRSGETEHPALAPELGYAREIDYFLKCVREGRAPETVNLQNSLGSLRIHEAEAASLESGRAVSL